MKEEAIVCEVGPRDGLQMAHSQMPTEMKLEWIGAMVQAGLRQIEVGSFVPPSVVPQMADTDAIVRRSVDIEGLTVLALVPNLKGAQLAYAAGAHVVTLPVSVSESHSRANTRKGTYEQVAMVNDVVQWVREQPRAMRIEAGCSTAFGCSMEGVVPEKRVVEVATALAETGLGAISLADTVGYGTPGQVHSLVRAVRASVGDRLDKLHFHDTMGMGLANVMAGLEEGIRAFDSALAGLGGCPFAPGASGNIVTEDLVFMLESAGLDTGIDLARLIETRRYLQRGLPDEPMHGQVARAGIPKTYHAAATVI